MLATPLEELFNPYIEIDANKVQTNMVFFKITKKNFDHAGFIAHLLDNHIKIAPPNSDNDFRYRFVTHNDIDTDDINYVLGVIKEYAVKISRSY
jgi:threonine aldolase